MARTILKNKTALVYGADSPAGRAVALQLSREGARVVLAGYDAGKLSLLHDLIKTKRGDPYKAVLMPERNRIIAVLQDARDAMGNHYHFLVNCLAAVEGPSDNPSLFVRRAQEVYGIFEELTTSRGSVRLLTIWPDEAGDPPKIDPVLWHCMVRVTRLEMGHDEVRDKHPADMVKAGGVADASVFLLSCPPSACPVEVRLEPRNIKA